MDKLFAVILALLLILAMNPAMALRAGCNPWASAHAIVGLRAEEDSAPWDNPLPFSNVLRPCAAAKDAAARQVFCMWLRKKSPGRHPPSMQYLRAWREQDRFAGGAQWPGAIAGRQPLDRSNGKKGGCR